VDSEAAAAPVVSVVPGVTSVPVAVAIGAITPELVANTTGTPDTIALLAFLAIAVIVAGVEPFDGICGMLVTSAMDATVLSVDAPLLLLELVPAKELGSLPPQPARQSAAATILMNHPYLRIVFT
jgi:hypothetical protein